MNHLFGYRSLGLGVLAAACLVLPAQATASSAVDTSACKDLQLSQPFLSWKDSNWYELIPGQSADNFDGTGWELSGGATIKTTTLADGTTGEVLDLPSGSKAVAPTICVQSNYPFARTMVRDVKGSEGVFFYVSYDGGPTWVTPKNTGQVHGNGTSWTLAGPVNLQPAKTTGWQLLKVTLIPGGKTSDFQIYNLYADPRMLK